MPLKFDKNFKLPIYDEFENGICRIRKGVEHIPSGEFRDCKELKEIIIPSSVSTIECDAFLGCENLKKITLPASVKEIRCWDRQRKYSISDFRPFSLPFDKLTDEGLALDLISDTNDPNFWD